MDIEKEIQNLEADNKRIEKENKEAWLKAIDTECIEDMTEHIVRMQELKDEYNLNMQTLIALKTKRGDKQQLILKGVDNEAASNN